LSLAAWAAPAAARVVVGDPDEAAARIARFPASRGTASEPRRLARLSELYLAYNLAEGPETATRWGDTGAEDRWYDLSPEASQRRKRTTRALLAAVRSIDRRKLGPEEAVSWDLLRRGVELGIEALRFPDEAMANTQLWGIQLWIPQTLRQMPAATAADYRHILARLAAIPRLLAQQQAELERWAAQGITPPRPSLLAMPQQVANLLPADPAESPLLVPFKRLPESLPEAERRSLTAEALRLYGEQVAPAFRRFQSFLVERYLPASRETIALTDLPDGAAWYALKVRAETTTDLTPGQIHDIGLAEVARIRGEMEKVLAQAGFAGSLAEFFEFLRSDPRFFYERPEELVTAYRDIAKRADGELPRLFGKLPRLTYGVLPVPAYAEKQVTTAYYEPGAPAAGRAGVYFVNTWDLKSRPKWEMEALSLHESVPGHHLQIALGQELEGVPEWRRRDSYTAFAEGWALYAESLGDEMGFYKDPYSRFGQLTYQMWRAVRLVVDTGIQVQGWSRQQAIDYFAANAPKARHDIEVEVDRYIAWPGQALAYKIGELKIKQLRAYAERELGSRFDVRAFHDRILARGAVPLDFLETDVKAWVHGLRGTKDPRDKGPKGLQGHQ